DSVERSIGIGREGACCDGADMAVEHADAAGERRAKILGSELADHLTRRDVDGEEIAALFEPAAAVRTCRGRSGSDRFGHALRAAGEGGLSGCALASGEEGDGAAYPIDADLSDRRFSDGTAKARIDKLPKEGRLDERIGDVQGDIPILYASEADEEYGSEGILHAELGVEPRIVDLADH